MFEHTARKRGLASLAPVALFMVVVTGCVSAAPGAGTVGTSGGYSVQDRSEGQLAGVATGNAVEHRLAEGPREAPATLPKVSKSAPTQSRGGWQVGLTGTKAGGGGPQR
jgi:hypothetical protein